MKISVIIPVYNVEDYINDCIQSIINQTFKDYEILLIDDGSTDNSGKICDKYNNEEKVRIYHTKNKGLSEARNFGIKMAIGDYVAFIDSDDFVSTNYLEALYKITQLKNTEISVISSFDVSENSHFKKQKPKIDFSRIKTITKDDALIKMLSREGFGIAAWGKLFDKKLFDDIKFPKDRLFEDLITIPIIFDKCNNIAFLESEEPLYYWRTRSNSITRDTSVNDKISPLLCSLNELKNKFWNKSKKLNYAIQARYTEEIINILINKLIFEKKFKEMWNNIYMYDKNIWSKFYLNNNISFLKKIRIFLLIYMPSLYQKLTIKHIKNKKSDG